MKSRTVSFVLCIVSLAAAVSALESYRLNIKPAAGNPAWQIPTTDEKETFLQLTSETRSERLLRPGQAKSADSGRSPEQSFNVYEKGARVTETYTAMKAQFLGTVLGKEKDGTDLLKSPTPDNPNYYEIRLNNIANPEIEQYAVNEAVMNALVSDYIKGIRAVVNQVPPTPARSTFSPVLLRNLPNRPEVPGFLSGGIKKIGGLFKRTKKVENKSTDLLEVIGAEDREEGTWYVQKYHGFFVTPEKLENELRKAAQNAQKDKKGVPRDEAALGMLHGFLEEMRASELRKATHNTSEERQPITARASYDLMMGTESEQETGQGKVHAEDLLGKAVDRPTGDSSLVEVFEWCNKGTLNNVKDWYARPGLLSPALAPFFLEFGVQMFSTINHLGQSGIIHGAINPASIYLTLPVDGTAVETRMGDFSLASSWQMNDILNHESPSKTAQPYFPPEVYLCLLKNKDLKNDPGCFPSQSLGRPYFSARDVYAAGKTIIGLFGVEDREMKKHRKEGTTGYLLNKQLVIKMPAFDVARDALAGTLDDDYKERLDPAQMVEKLDVQKLWMKFVADDKLKNDRRFSPFYKFLEKPFGSYCDFLRSVDDLSKKTPKLRDLVRETGPLGQVYKFVHLSLQPSSLLGTSSQGPSQVYQELCGPPKDPHGAIGVDVPVNELDHEYDSSSTTLSV